MENTVAFKRKITIWDFGGHAKVRHLRRNYYHLQQAVIYVVDATDSDYEYENTAIEFHKALNEPELKDMDIPLLIYANKCDLPNSEPIYKILKRMEAHKINKKWFIKMC